VKQQARTFDNLRGDPKLKSEHAKDKAQVVAAWRRIAKTPDGQTALGWLMATTIHRSLGAGVSDGALREHEGKRQLAALIEQMCSEE
jgi:hypothetical protein